MCTMYWHSTTKNFIVPESDNANIRCLQHMCAFLIVQTLLFIVMPTAIKFNSKTGILAVEIEDISANRMLPAKLEATETASSQNLPKQKFCICLLLAKLPGENK